MLGRGANPSANHPCSLSQLDRTSTSSQISRQEDRSAVHHQFDLPHQVPRRRFVLLAPNPQFRRYLREFLHLRGAVASHGSKLSTSCEPQLNRISLSQIRTTHGLNDFAELQDVKPVIDELRLLQTHWASLTQHEEEFGEMLFEATMLLEEAADPNDWGELIAEILSYSP